MRSNFINPPFIKLRGGREGFCKHWELFRISTSQNWCVDVFWIKDEKYYSL